MVYVPPRMYVLDHAAYTIPTREHVVDRTRSGLFLPVKDLGHELAIDVLSAACASFSQNRGCLARSTIELLK